MSRLRIAVALAAFTCLLSVVVAALPSQNPRAAKPQPEHALLKKLAGKWNTTFTFSMPGAPPMSSKGTEVNELLGDLWIVSRYDDPNMMGGAFAGAELMGWDTDAKQYVTAWVDNQSSDLSTQKGSYDEAKKTLTLSGSSKDPMTGAESTVRTVVTFKDDDHRSQSMFVPGPGGKEMKLFTIEYERAK